MSTSICKKRQSGSIRCSQMSSHKESFNYHLKTLDAASHSQFTSEDLQLLPATLKGQKSIISWHAINIRLSCSLQTFRYIMHHAMTSFLYFIHDMAVRRSQTQNNKYQTEQISSEIEEITKQKCQGKYLYVTVLD